MKVSEVAQRLNAKVHTCTIPEFEVEKVYAGDFLSRVISKAPKDSIWLTIMANVNVAGVATLAEIKAVVLCESVVPDKLLTEKCENEGIALFTTDLSVYECCKRL